MFNVAGLRPQGRHQGSPRPRQQIEDLLFAYRVAKFVKSNAIVFCGNGMTLGVGAGQMSRVDSTKIASIKAQQAGLELKGSVVASDAFFPFRRRRRRAGRSRRQGRHPAGWFDARRGSHRRRRRTWPGHGLHRLATALTSCHSEISPARRWMATMMAFLRSPKKISHETTGNRFRRPRARHGLAPGQDPRPAEGLRRPRQRRHGARTRAGKHQYHRPGSAG